MLPWSRIKDLYKHSHSHSCISLWDLLLLSLYYRVFSEVPPFYPSHCIMHHTICSFTTPCCRVGYFHWTRGVNSNVGCLIQHNSGPPIKPRSVSDEQREHIYEKLSLLYVARCTLNRFNSNFLTQRAIRLLKMVRTIPLPEYRGHFIQSWLFGIPTLSP